MSVLSPFEDNALWNADHGISSNLYSSANQVLVDAVVVIENINDKKNSNFEYSPIVGSKKRHISEEIYYDSSINSEFGEKLLNDLSNTNAETFSDLNPAAPKFEAIKPANDNEDFNYTENSLNFNEENPTKSPLKNREENYLPEIWATKSEEQERPYFEYHHSRSTSPTITSELPEHMCHRRRRRHSLDSLDFSVVGVRDMASFLRSLRLHKYTEQLTRIGITLEILLTLDEKGLIQVGINTSGARRRLLLAMEKYQQYQHMRKLQGPETDLRTLAARPKSFSLSRLPSQGTTPLLVSPAIIQPHNGSSSASTRENSSLKIPQKRSCRSRSNSAPSSSLQSASDHVQLTNMNSIIEERTHDSIARSLIPVAEQDQMIILEQDMKQEAGRLLDLIVDENKYTSVNSRTSPEPNGYGVTRPRRHTISLGNGDLTSYVTHGKISVWDAWHKESVASLIPQALFQEQKGLENRSILKDNNTEIKGPLLMNPESDHHNIEQQSFFMRRSISYDENNKRKPLLGRNQTSWIKLNQ